MGAKSGDRVGSETASSTSNGEGTQLVAEESVPSRSTHDVVYLASGADTGVAYHTSRLCPDFPGSGEAMDRPVAEDDGHPFCWTCFELEMRALADG
jgi:hypothetical protein